MADKSEEHHHGPPAGDDWGDDQSARLRDAGYKIVRFGGPGIIYVGQVDYDDKPDGTGFMFLPNGDIHQCEFRNGRADGKGIYMTSKGTEMAGEWRMNMRVGEFKIVDGKGVHWLERYNDEGKKTARKKVINASV
ncbi:hypothetical protein PTSG_10062 [Salpingoeca rosetta]|uniref:Uncharacterized protein n=1 Tax=Salpingoeca rosetta (strain ATCC 50818 / BSB-021) TaxID=946362 RepID=F2UPD8_SALR5|nr:uncharacterized protein PTSG_10062 [Salpingoeca rosetta]EGD79493.1 hypothetical protein PTSG_10062 [Salpingoeca rosetta]|eukprot:XP_004988974.1 hypothetical protein PTSG_10062 [Salpingoeca rosetta]